MQIDSEKTYDHLFCKSTQGQGVWKQGVEVDIVLYQP